MALSIKTERADRLARELARRTGESMTQAVETALDERLQRLGPEHSKEGYVQRLLALAAEMRQEFDFSNPVTKEEWDAACGDTEGELGF